MSTSLDRWRWNCCVCMVNRWKSTELTLQIRTQIEISSRSSQWKGKRLFKSDGDDFVCVHSVQPTISPHFICIERNIKLFHFISKYLVEMPITANSIGLVNRENSKQLTPGKLDLQILCVLVTSYIDQLKL